MPVTLTGTSTPRLYSPRQSSTTSSRRDGYANYCGEARMRIVIDASGTVLMYSDTGQPAPDVGQTAIDLSPDLQASFVKAIATAPSGLTFDGQSFTPIPPPPPPIPQHATPLQMRCALRQLCLLDQVNAYVATQTPNMQDSGQFARTIPISNPMVVSVGAA